MVQIEELEGEGWDGGHRSQYLCFLRSIICIQTKLCRSTLDATTSHAL